MVHFEPSRAWKSNFNFEYGDDSVEIVPEYKYLGVIFDEHLSGLDLKYTNGTYDL